MFPEMDTSRRILEHKNDDSHTLTNLFTGALTKEGNKDLAEKYPQDVRDQCRFFFVVPLRHVRNLAIHLFGLEGEILQGH